MVFVSWRLCINICDKP